MLFDHDLVKAETAERQELIETEEEKIAEAAAKEAESEAAQEAHHKGILERIEEAFDGPSEAKL